MGTIIAINQFTYSFGPGLLGWLRDAYGSYAAPPTACLALQLAAVGVLLLGGLRPAPSTMAVGNTLGEVWPATLPCHTPTTCPPDSGQGGARISGPR